MSQMFPENMLVLGVVSKKGHVKPPYISLRDFRIRAIGYVNICCKALNR